MGKKKGGSVLVWIIGFLVIGLIGYGITNLSRVISENNDNQKKANISLNDYIRDGRDFPVGKYVSLDVRWVAGPYATNTHTETTNGISSTSGVDQYYAVVLEDDSIMSICTSNKKEIEKLDQMAKWLEGVPGLPTNGEVLHLQGDLKELSDMAGKNSDQLTGYYKTFLSGATKKVRYLVLNTKAGRDGIYLWLFGGAAVLILILWIRHRSKKKKEAAYAAASEQKTMNF